MTRPDLEDDGGKRRLWISLMPGLTEAIFTKAAFDCGVVKRVTIGDQTVDLWPKIGEMDGETWSLLRRTCAIALGLPASWEQKQLKPPAWWKLDPETAYRRKSA